MEIGIERKCKTDTWLGGGKPQGRPRGYGKKLQQRRDLARMRQASRLWKLQQRRDLARMRQAGLEAIEAMEIAIDAMESEQNRHLARMRQASRQASRQALRLWKLQQRRDLAKVREDSIEAGLHTHTYIDTVTHEQKTCYTSRLERVILAQGPC